MDNEQRPRRSILGLIFPYLIIAAIIGVFAWFMISKFVNQPVTWNADSVDAKLNANDIITAEVYNQEVVTSVSGTAQGSDGKPYKYTFTVDTYQYREAFDTDADGAVDHASYRSILIDKIQQFKAAHPEYDDNKSFLRENYAFNTPWYETWGPAILTAVVSIGLGVFLFFRLTRVVGRENGRAMDFNKSRARKIEKSNVKFDDVAGCDEEKAEMVELVDYLKDPKKFTKFGAKLPKGILLVGAPGTGKTLLAKAVAGEAGVPFYSISGSDFVEMFVGVGAGRVRDMFRTAKQNAPCLVFIDEIDAVGRQRGAGLGGGNDEREQTLNQLLVEMDGFEDNSGVIVIAATNRDDVLDPALLRAGRFDRTITVSLPDRAGREAIFKVHARNKKLDPAVDFASLAKRTVGFSGADIENILNEAAILAIRGNKNAITMADIDEAIDRRIAGPAKASKGMNDNERKQVAYHEAGHAIIGLRLKNSDKVQKITIVPRGRTGGHVLMTPEDDRFLLSQSELEARIVGYLGGRSSEEVFFKDVSTGASNDIEVATRIARLMVTEYGMSSLGPIQYERDTGSVFLGRDYTSTQKNFSTQIAYEIDTEVRKIIDKAHKEALRIIKENKDDVILIAETLLENETITAEQIDYLLKNRKLPDENKPQVIEAEAKPVEEKKEEKPAVKKPRTKKVKEEPKE